MLYDNVKLIYLGGIEELEEQLTSFRVAKIVNSRARVCFELTRSLGLIFMRRTEELKFVAPPSEREAFKDQVYRDLGLSPEAIKKWSKECGTSAAAFVHLPVQEWGAAEREKPFQGLIAQTLYIYSHRPFMINMEGHLYRALQ